VVKVKSAKEEMCNKQQAPGVTGLGKAGGHLSNFSWEAMRKKQTVSRKCIKITPGRPYSQQEERPPL